MATSEPMGFFYEAKELMDWLVFIELIDSRARLRLLSHLNLYSKIDYITKFRHPLYPSHDLLLVASRSSPATTLG